MWTFDWLNRYSTGKNDAICGKITVSCWNLYEIVHELCIHQHCSHQVYVDSLSGGKQNRTVLQVLIYDFNLIWSNIWFTKKSQHKRMYRKCSLDSLLFTTGFSFVQQFGTALSCSCCSFGQINWPKLLFLTSHFSPMHIKLSPNPRIASQTVWISNTDESQWVWFKFFTIFLLK